LSTKRRAGRRNAVETSDTACFGRIGTGCPRTQGCRQAGQKLGIKDVDDGICLVSFMHYDLGYIDPEQRTLQTIDKPFGTR
jgi:hypothetical protein